MGGGLVLVVVGVDVVAAHGVVDELVPHEEAAEVGVAVEVDAVEVEDLALLKFGAAPDGGEGGEMRVGVAVCGAEAEGEWAVVEFVRVEVVDDFEVAGGDGLLDLFDFLFCAVDLFEDFDFGGDFFGGPVDAGYVGAEVEAEVGGVAEPGGGGEGVFGVDEERVLRGGAGVEDDLCAAAGEWPRVRT